MYTLEYISKFTGALVTVKGLGDPYSAETLALGVGSLYYVIYSEN